MGATNSNSNHFSGVYLMTRLNGGIAKMDVWTVEIKVLSGPLPPDDPE